MRAMGEGLEELIAAGDRHRKNGTIRFQRQTGRAGLGRAQTPALRAMTFREHAKSLVVHQNLESMPHGPGILLAAINREGTEITKRNIQRGEFEQLRLSHEEDHPPHGKLHGNHIPIRIVIARHNQRTVRRYILQAVHFEFHDQVEQLLRPPADKSPERGFVEDKLLPIAGVEFSGVG